jgi:hypothetical protein
VEECVCVYAAYLLHVCAHHEYSLHATHENYSLREENKHTETEAVAVRKAGYIVL